MNHYLRVNGCSRVVAFALCVAACAPKTSGVLPEEALRTVERFIQLDTLGQGRTDSASALFAECAARVSDAIEPVRSVRVGAPTVVLDTVQVIVEYGVLGYLNSWDVAQVGSRNWRFTSAPTVVTDTFRVIRAESQAPVIVCGPHYGNHPSFHRMTWYYQRMDDSSRAAWNVATTFATGGRQPR